VATGAERCGPRHGGRPAAPRRGVPLSCTTRRLALLGSDLAAWLIGLTAGVWMRYEGDPSPVFSGGFVAVLLIALGTHVLVATPGQLYQGRYSIGSVEDAIAVGSVIGVAGLVAFGAALLPDQPPVARSVPLIGALVVLVLAVVSRVGVRLVRERRARPDGRMARRVIVLGADVEGQQLVQSMTSDPDSGYLPVALLDDDPEAQHRRVCRVAVRGTHRDIADVARATRAELLVVAAREVTPAAMHEASRAAADAGLRIKVLPRLGELLQPQVRHTDLRNLDITDLLGRRPVEIDVPAIAGYLTGRRVLVTGAGGSIGSELCSQIHRYGPAELMMLDRDESALHATQLSIHGRALLDSSDLILADIRDADGLTALFVGRRPDVVFHAAALKHLPMLERFPQEAWRTNVIGTQNVLDAAWHGGATKVVNISTDKAADPVSVLGRSKRIGERLVADAAAFADGTYLSVRFGNVLGSRGSVLTTFTEQIAAGGPVTITHPDVTRFLMTIPEAGQLVVHAAAIGRRGEALVLDMGEAVRISDIAQQLMHLAGRSVEIVYTGLRDGEKLHEVLLGQGERDHRPIHPAVSHVPVPPLPAMWACDHANRVGVARALVDLPQFPSRLPLPVRPIDGRMIRPRYAS
jgi:FlaA1/EpsC-like NDP-sugar epimerase